MPVRSLNSRVLRWPDAREVLRAVSNWAEHRAAERPDVEAIGVAGSYARGNWSVGSDVDIVVLVRSSETPFMARPRSWSLEGIPVPADLLIYTRAEWREMKRRGGGGEVLPRETHWVYRRQAQRGSRAQPK